MPMLDFQQQFSHQSRGNNGDLPALTPFGQPSFNACGVQSRLLTPASVGVKRSRDDAAENLEDDDYFHQAATPPAQKEEDWTYGEGMTLVRPNGFIIDPASQTGTWAEEKAEQSRPATPPAASRPVMRNHKSQRLDLSATPAIGDDRLSNYAPSSSPIRQSPTRNDPAVDDYTIHLGIGWSKISADEDMQAAARGWAKYIENHFNVTSPKILLQSRGLSSYLVEAREGWFLFGDDLKQGRLVATTLTRTFEHLRTSPPSFDGEEVLVAVAETPKVELAEEDLMDAPHVYSGSLYRRKEFLNGTEATGAVGAADAHNPHNLNLNGQAPVDTEMDMS